MTKRRNLMKAVVFDRYGPPEVMRIVDQPRPVPSDDEVLIRIHASVATPPDCAFRSADPFIIRLMFGLFRPRNNRLGTVVAGVVETVGKNVTRFSPGQRIYGASDDKMGAYAQYIALPETGMLGSIPDGVSFGEAAGLCEGFLTAVPFLRDEAGLQPGQSILINGASGNIGSTAVQLAKDMGAEVTGVASARNRDLVLSLGADRFIDYNEDDFTTHEGRYDVIFDAVGKSGFSRSKPALKAKGVYMTTVPSFSIIIPTLRAKKAKGKRGLLATTGLRKPEAKLRDLHLLSQMIAEGKLRCVIDRTYPLEKISEAHAYVETGRKRGSVVIEMPA
jgi:NADPH:quinone reductase-like Zn-dependent oxidoreductase